MLWVLRLFGYPVLTFGPEMLCDEPEEEYRISNTGGTFERAVEGYSPEDDDLDYEIPPDDPQYGFGFGR